LSAIEELLLQFCHPQAVTRTLVFLSLWGLLGIASTGAAQSIQWHDAASLRIEGRGWPEANRPFTRLPAHAEGRVTAAVWNLQTNTAGLAIPFRTTSPSLVVEWSGGGAMVHMPATGVSGLDLYERAGETWTFRANLRPNDGETSRTVSLTPADSTGDDREYWLYLPLYHAVDFLRLGVADGSHFSQPAPYDEKAVVFYGTSIVQGGCASRPGMAHVAILGRWLNRPVINLGFSGSAQMEPAMADLLAELDPALYVIDSLPNVNDQLMAERYEPFIRRLRKARPHVPIVMVGHLKPKSAALRNGALSALHRRLTAEGLSQLHLLPGESLLRGPEEGTVDGVHPTDLGFLHLAEAHFPLLQRILAQQPTR
jgi:hypothetical protein